MKEQLIALLQQTGESQLTELSDEKLNKLIALVEQLAKWNKAYNLTSVRDPEQMLAKHIVDSLVIGPYLQGDHFIDVGTGPGLPGLPLAILYPQRSFVLLDSLGKRIRFIRQVCHQLGIENVTAVQSRVEEYDDVGKGFDGVISRAFASLNDMLNWCKHLPASMGKFYALKGQYPQQEVDEISQQYSIDEVHRLQVPGVEGDRHIVVISAK